MKYRILSMAVLLALGVMGLQVATAAPRLINYQGILHDDMGDPLNGTFDLTFLISPDTLPGTDSSWSETHPDVQVTEGLFNVILGGIEPIDDRLFEYSDERWLSVAVPLVANLDKQCSGSEARS